MQNCTGEPGEGGTGAATRAASLPLPRIHTLMKKKGTSFPSTSRTRTKRCDQCEENETERSKNQELKHWRHRARGVDSILPRPGRNRTCGLQGEKGDEEAFGRETKRPESIKCGAVLCRFTGERQATQRTGKEERSLVLEVSFGFGFLERSREPPSPVSGLHRDCGRSRAACRSGCHCGPR